MTGITDELGTRYVTYSYDSSGRATNENLWSGSNQTLPVTPFTLSFPGNNQTVVTDPLGTSRTFQFEVNQGLLVLDSMSQTCTGSICPGYATTKANTWDQTSGMKLSSTDFNGVVTTYTNDNTRDLETQRVEASGTAAQRTITTVWDANYRVPDQRSVGVGTTPETLTNWTYNSRGQVTSRCIVDPNVSGATSYTCGSATNAPTGVRQWKYTYCDSVGTGCPIVGLLKTVDGPRLSTDVSDVTTYAYYQTTDLSGCATLGGVCHNAGDLQSVTNAMGQVTTYVSYDKNGRVTRMQDANGTYTDMTYHARGWLLTRTVRANANGSASSNDATTTFAYDNAGNATKVTQPDGAYLSYTYDSAHRLTKIADNYNNYISYALDTVGNRTSEKTYDPSSTLKRSLSRQYDQLNHLTNQLNAASATVQNYQNPADAPPPGVTYTDGYDGDGNAIYSVDGNSVGTEQQYDPLNRLVKTLQDHAGAGATHDTTTQYAYDTRDNLRSVTDPDNLGTSYTYDGLNNLTALSSPDTSNTGYTYDAAGNRATQTDARGITSTYSYDAINRLTGISYPTTRLNVTYTYDVPATNCYNTGRLTKITDNSGNTTYCYDRRGNILSKAQVTNGVTLTTSYAYTLADRLSGITYPSGAIITYVRDNVGRITSVTYKANANASAVTVLSGISYYPFGPQNVLTFGNGRTLTKTYDSDYAIDKIVSSNSTGLVIDGTVDVLGNLTNASSTVGASPVTQQYQYDPLYRLTNVQDGSGTSLESFTYDLTGDRLSKTLSGTNSPYTYTAGTHHLASVAGVSRSYDANGNTTAIGSSTDTYDNRNRLTAAGGVSYNYNGRGERVFKSGVLFAYDEGGRTLGEYTTAGALGAEYVYVDSIPVAYVSGGVLYYVETDQLGTPRQLILPGATTSTDTQMWKWDYFASNSAFGENTPSVQAITFNLRFPGQYFDAETGLNYNYFRDYEPGTGRYVESDPIGINGGIDTYLYADANPLVTVDPNGQGPLKLIKLCVQGYKELKLLTFPEAVKAARRGEDVLASSHKEAKQIARAASESGKYATRDPAHGDGMMPHYHPKPRTGAHVFYQIAGALTFEHYVECTDCWKAKLAWVGDFINPLSTPQDLIDLTGAGDDDGGE
jgi:RHS repeat-associated protein